MSKSGNEGSFTGFTKIELEMMLDTIKSALPALLTIAPSWAELVRKNYDELRKQGFNDRQAMYMAVLSAAKQFGVG